MEVVLRHEVVETARAGDKMAFVGNLIVVPDVAAISAPGERVEARAGEVCEIVCDWAFGFGVCHPAAVCAADKLPGHCCSSCGTDSRLRPQAEAFCA